MNRVNLVGRITKEIEYRVNDKGTGIVNNSIAVNRTFKNENGEYDADFINFVAFSYNAEYLKKYAKKGSLIAIDGRIQTGSYEDKEGNKRYTTDVLVENASILDKREATQNDTQVATQTNEQNDPFADFGNEVNIDDNFLD